MIETQRFLEQTNRHRAFFFGLHKFVDLRKLKKLRHHLAKKKEQLKTRNKKECSALLFFSAISRSFLQFVFFNLSQHCLLTQNNEIFLKRKS
jgi:hypothetical protein